MVILENIDIDIDIDIDKAILQNIDIDKISNRFKFGISNRATQHTTKEILSSRWSPSGEQSPPQSSQLLPLFNICLSVFWEFSNELPCTYDARFYSVLKSLFWVHLYLTCFVAFRCCCCCTHPQLFKFEKLLIVVSIVFGCYCWCRNVKECKTIVPVVCCCL